VRAVPGAGLRVPLWILGSSLFGAQLAAALGLPFAFASHFAPAQMLQAIAIYRAQFQPSAQLARPYVMLGYNVFAADSIAEAKVRATSWQQAFINLRSGRPSQLPPPLEDYLDRIGPHERALLDDVMACSVIGSPEVVHAAFARLHRPHRRGRIDDRNADLRPRCPPALLRDHRASAPGRCFQSSIMNLRTIRIVLSR
jgi:luciferase family oxidoreductase group 1